jgi:hypothetical protein
MDTPPDWAVTFIVIAIGLSPGLALLSARSIARPLHRELWPRPEAAPQSRREPVRQEPASVSAGRGVDCSGAT